MREYWHGPPLSNSPVQRFVIDLGAGGHVRLQDLYAVVLQKLVYRVFRVLQVHQLTAPRRASLDARRIQALADAVVAQRTLIHRVLLGIDVAAAIWARHHAVSAPEAIFLVH